MKDQPMTDQTSQQAAELECWDAFELAIPNAVARTVEAWRGFQAGWQARAKHAQPAVESERGKVLSAIRQAVEQHNKDLHDRKHGGVAMDKAWWKIIAALGTIKSQQPAQADKDKPCQ
jgi:hypothetical protein